jgi:LPXTG-motif cell wall-anchored protein
MCIPEGIMSTILIVLVLFLLLGGGGYYGYRRNRL